MAIIHYVKFGQHPNYNQGRNIPTSDIIDKLRNLDIKYLRNNPPPKFNPNNQSQYPEVVVIQITPDEVGEEPLNQIGFYALVGTTPQEAENIFFK